MAVLPPTAKKQHPHASTKTSKKKSRKPHSSAVVRSKTSTSRGRNPFDARCNASKPKYEVLGRRVKGASRNVAAARAAAELKRRKTLGVEFCARKKSNVFKDKRLGEQDPTLSLEDKMMARFQTERKRQMRNAAAFALHDSDNDNEKDEDGYGGLFLTHRGSRISEDKEEEEEEMEKEGRDGHGETEEDWKMDREIVDTLHFGGGRKAGELEDENVGRVGRKTHKEVMQEVMMKAKLYKAERQKNKSAQEDATDSLDAGFADLRGLLEFRPTRANGKEVVPKEPLDDFDTLTREFAFEAKVQATERRMSPEEVAAKERDRLAELEKKRVARMLGATVDESDDDGRKGRKSSKKKKKKTVVVTTLKGVTMPPTDDDLMDGYAVDDRFVDSAEDGEEEEEAADGDGDGDESDDVDSEAASEEEEEEEEVAGDQIVVEEEVDDADAHGQQRLDDAEEAARELPFVFPCPASPDALAALFTQHARHSPAKRALILDRLVTYYNPRLSVENQSKMKTLFAVVIRHFLVLAAKYAKHKQDLDALASTMFTIAQQLGDACAVVVRELLAQLYTRLHRRHASSAWPSLPELLLFKALTRVFPTSDLRHNVLSPMETLLGESLARGAVASPDEATQALMAASLSLDMTRAKARFMPELVTFFTRLLRAFVIAPTTTTTATTATATATTVSSDYQAEQLQSSHWLRRDLRYIQKTRAAVSSPATRDPTALPRLSLAATSSTPSSRSSSSSSSGSKSSSSSSSSPRSSRHVLTSLLALLELAAAQYARLPSFDELFYPLYLLLHALAPQLDAVARDAELTALAARVRCVVSALHARLVTCWEQRRPLALQRFAPTVLPSFAPHFDAQYAVRKDKMAPKDTAQLQQLKRQVKRARRGAARELRRDAAFLQGEKQKEEERRREAKDAKQKEIRRWLEEDKATFNQQVRKGGNMLKGGGSARGRRSKRA